MGLSASRMFIPARGSGRGTTLVANLFDSFMGKKTFAAPCVMGKESIMAPKAHGTSTKRVQEKLRWSCKVPNALGLERSTR